MIDYAELARAIGMDETEAALWQACCRAEAHYSALQKQGAAEELIQQAWRTWDDAAWQYARYKGGGDE